jgi:hypothetical protein
VKLFFEDKPVNLVDVELLPVLDNGRQETLLHVKKEESWFSPPPLEVLQTQLHHQPQTKLRRKVTP